MYETIIFSAVELFNIEVIYHFNFSIALCEGTIFPAFRRGPGNDERILEQQEFLSFQSGV